ncbi:MAG: hypothetical protein ACEY3C_02225, partial [Candidatus Tisiphia sp.]
QSVNNSVPWSKDIIDLSFLNKLDGDLTFLKRILFVLYHKILLIVFSLLKVYFKLIKFSNTQLKTDVFIKIFNTALETKFIILN